jgi:hypothetical protein
VTVCRAVAQAVSRRPVTVETRVRDRGQSIWDLWWTEWHWDRFSSSTSVFPCQFNSTGAPLHGKTRKPTIFITGLHNKPQGCGASVASAAGSFTARKKSVSLPYLELTVTAPRMWRECCPIHTVGQSCSRQAPVRYLSLCLNLLKPSGDFTYHQV